MAPFLRGWPESDHPTQHGRTAAALCWMILATPEGMVPNFEPKIDLKKDEICIFGPFLGPNDLFRPYIIPNGAYERIRKISDTLPLKAELSNHNCLSVEFECA